MEKYNVAVVGVGAVGVEMVRCLKQRNFPLDKLSLFARRTRAMSIDNENYQVESISAEAFDGVDIALFAGTEGEKGAALQWAPIAVEKKALVIDNGADFRLQEDVPLIVPEINKERVKTHKGIIANPNCTTIQMVVALAQIQKRFGIEQIILTSLQATSGAGKKAAIQLWQETKQIAESNKDKDFNSINKLLCSKSEVFPHQIAFNVIPKIGSFKEDGYTSEELKTVQEVHKIFEDSSIKITSTCVRVPVFTSHSEAIYFRTKKQASLDDIKKALDESEGVAFSQDPANLTYPIDAEGKDKVFVARVRYDPFNKDSFWLWCVSDNLRKGAALNAVQIAESFISL